jgi:DNA-binding transcriptional ArsR family regulator
MKKNINSQMIVYLYDTEELSTHEIASKLKISQSTVRYHLKKMNKPLRNRSLAQKSFLKNNNHQRLGKRHTELSKQKISRANLKGDFLKEIENEDRIPKNN